MPPTSGRQASCCENRSPIASLDHRVALGFDSEALSLPPNRSISRSPRSPSSSSTTCPACWRRSGARCRPDGLLLAAMIGGDTLTELRQAFADAEAECEGGVSPRVAPFADLRDVGALLQRAGFALPVTDVDRLVVRYDNAFALMRDLRRMGATNVMIERRRTPTAPRHAAADGGRSTPAALPIPTAASAPPSTSSGCPAGRRMKASPSRCGRDRRKRVWRRR